MKKLLVLLLCGAALLSAAKVSGRVSDITGRPYTQGTYVNFELQNCNGNIPRVVAASIIVPTVKSLYPNSQGLLQGDIIGNDIITCDILGNTYYRVTIWAGSSLLADRNYRITGTAWNLTSATPIQNSPTPFLPPVGGFPIGGIYYYGNGGTLAVTPNTTTTPKLLLQTGDGTTVTSTAWGTITPEMLPSGIPANKITGLVDPSYTGDISNSSTAVTVTGLRGNPVNNATPSSNDFLAYTSSQWRPSSLAGVMGSLAAARSPSSSAPKVWVYNGSNVVIADLDASMFSLTTIGGIPTVQSSGPIVNQEYFTAASDGQSFTLAYTPVAGPQPAAVYKNGIKVRLGGGFDYTITGTTLAFTSNNPIVAGDLVEIIYWR